MQDLPTPAAILDLVITQLANAEPTTPERGKFEQRVIIAALQLVHRELKLAPVSDAAEQERLEALLEPGDLLALNRSLAARLRDGSLTLASRDVAAHLRATTMEKLAIDQPSYAAYKRALTSKD